MNYGELFDPWWCASVFTATGDQTTHSARCCTLKPWFSEKGSQESLRGLAEAADLLPEHSAGNRELHRAALGMC